MQWNQGIPNFKYKTFHFWFIGYNLTTIMSLNVVAVLRSAIPDKTQNNILLDIIQYNLCLHIWLEKITNDNEHNNWKKHESVLNYEYNFFLLIVNWNTNVYLYTLLHDGSIFKLKAFLLTFSISAFSTFLLFLVTYFTTEQLCSRANTDILLFCGEDIKEYCCFLFYIDYYWIDTDT